MKRNIQSAPDATPSAHESGPSEAMTPGWIAASSVPSTASSTPTNSTPIFARRFPIRTVSEMNQREHWTKRHKRKKAQQSVMLLILGAPCRLELPLRVVLTRIAPRKLDTDNLASSFKHVQDAAAKWIGVDDGDSRLTWVYAQEQLSKDYSVRMEVYCQ